MTGVQGIGWTISGMRPFEILRLVGDVLKESTERGGIEQNSAPSYAEIIWTSSLKMGMEESCLYDDEVNTEKKKIIRTFQGKHKQQKVNNPKRRKNYGDDSETYGEEGVGEERDEPQWMDSLCEVINTVCSAGLCYYGIPQLRMEKK
jgi:hypothetical protein